MALPIWAIYMKKVYNDRSLGYSQSETFSIPDDFSLCDDSLAVADSLFLNTNGDEILEIEEW